MRYVTGHLVVFAVLLCFTLGPARTSRADVEYTQAEEQALKLALQAAIHDIDPSKGISRMEFCTAAVRLLPQLTIPAHPRDLKPLMRPFVRQARDLCGIQLFNNKSATLSAPPRGACFYHTS